MSIAIGRASVAQPSKASEPRLNRKTTFYIGLILGTVAGGLLSSGSGFLYLLFSQDMVSVRDGEVQFEKSTEITTQTANPSVSGDGNLTASDTDGPAVNSGDNSQTTVDSDSSSTQGDRTQVTINGAVTINTAELPGFNRSNYIEPLDSTLISYSKDSNLQRSLLMRGSSDINRIDFDENEITILGRAYNSLFKISSHSDKSRFVFRLDGEQHAVNLQFGVPDAESRTTDSSTYNVKIYADGELLWSGECNRIEGNQGSQIISAPLEIPGVQTLTLEVTGNGRGGDRLYFTTAQVLKN